MSEQTLDEILNEDDGDQFLSELGIDVNVETKPSNEVILFFILICVRSLTKRKYKLGICYEPS